MIRALPRAGGCWYVDGEGCVTRWEAQIFYGDVCVLREEGYVTLWERQIIYGEGFVVCGGEVCNLFGMLNYQDGILNFTR